MALIDIPVFLIGFALGFWACWREKAKIEALIPEGEALAKKLEAEAAAIQAKAAAVRAAIKSAA